MLKTGARHAAGDKELFLYSLVSNRAALEFRRQNSLSSGTATFEDTRPHKFPSDLAPLCFLSCYGLPRFMAEEKFIFVPSLRRNRGLQSLIPTIALTRDVADGQFTHENFKAAKLTSAEILRLRSFSCQTAGP